MTVVDMDYEGEWKCIDLECTHWDGDRCTLGFCEPDSPLYKKYLAWDKENFHKFEQSVTFREWLDNIPLQDNKNNVTKPD